MREREKGPEVFVLSEAPARGESGSGAVDLSKVNYWKEETTGRGNPREELLLREIVGLLQAIERKLDRLEKYLVRSRRG